MLRKIVARVMLLVILLSVAPIVKASCNGKFLNPITDICWSCLFPLTIGKFSLYAGGLSSRDTDNPGEIISICPKPPYMIPTPCIPIGFWEPFRLIDVVREPFCLVNLGGIKLGSFRAPHGTHSPSGKAKYGRETSFYHVHWYVYPVLALLEILVDFVCLDENKTFDVAWLSEFDPTWSDDGMNFIFNPEAILFGNPIAQAACSADCMTASISTASDKLLWCAGCQGSIYPFTGTVNEHAGGVQASLLIAARFIAKGHRTLMLKGTSGREALCSSYVCPVIKKSQYRLQLTYPRSATSRELGCHPIGKTSVMLESLREFPIKGEDFGYLVWRKKNCCIL